MNKIICYFLTILSLGSGDFSRESKQFKDSLFEMSTESNVAMSLVDALQNWADALEAQISMMRGEVLDLKTENTKLSDTVENLQNENGLLKSTLTNLDGNFMTFKGEQKADLKILSESFADFIDHFNDFSLNSHSNFSKVNQKFSSLDQKVGNLTEIDVKNAVKIGKNAENLMKITAENEALNANVQLLLYNASVAFFSDYERLQNQNTDLNKKIDLLKNDTISLQDQILSSLELVQIELSSSASNLESLNSSISHHLGKMEMNMTQISSKNEEMKQEIFQINGMVQGNVEALKTQANMSMELQEILHQTANSVSILRGNFTNSTLNFAISLHSLNEMSAYNSTLLQRGFFGLEKHFIEMKQKLFETQLQVVSVNSSTQNLGDLRGEVFNIGQVMANTTNLISKRFQDLSQTNSALQESLASLWNITDHLDAKVQKIHSNHSFVTGNFQNSLSDFQANLAKLQERNLNSSQKMDIFELGLKNLLNFSMDLDANVTILSHQTEKNEKNLTLNKRKIDKIYELYELQSERIIDNANIIKDNVTNLSVAANILEAELSRVASGFNGLKNALNRHISNTGNIEVNVQKLVTEGVFVKSELDSLRFDIAGVKAEASGFNVFVNSMQDHIQDLTLNMTMVHGNMTNMETDVNTIEMGMEAMADQITNVKSNVSEMTVQMGSNKEEIKDMGTSMETMKSNVMSLGSYINNINSDLGSMLTSFDGYAKKMNSEMGYVKSNLTDLNNEIRDVDVKTSDMKKKMDSMDYSTTTLKADVTELTTKVYNLKTTSFEQSNDLTKFKSTLKNLQNNLDSILKELTKWRSEENVQNADLQSAQSDLIKVKTAMTQLSASILELKSQQATSQVMDQKMAFLYTNITTIRTQLTTIRESISSFGPDMDNIHTDMAKFKTDFSGLSTELASLRNPARFSCAVTTDEIRTPGVISYSTCNVNSDAMMNKNTGHITIRDSGDYYLSFTANMVSVNSQAIWCAIYVQTPGTEGWQVLGMINNYQRDAGTEDDRDSGTISLITPLKAGDQVWVEWRGYGDSFLYSNPYRLISFTGFRVNFN